jgi:hypothetical protein
MHSEFKVAYGSGILLLSLILLTGFLRDNHLMGLVGTGLLIVGGFLVSFGFWGADYAFSVRLGELDQSKQDGRVKGEQGKVYVPFARNYSPVEWWNINWFIVAMGVVCIGFGAYYIGFLLGRLGL